MQPEPTRSILLPVSRQEREAPFFPRDYHMNLYRGCSHGCIYCDARSACYRLDNPGVVREKADALAILEGELRRKRTPGIVFMGGMSDAYNPAEAKALCTRGALMRLARYAFGVGITTKSPLAARDIDLLQRIRQNAPAYVTFSITTADDALCRRIEPGVAPTSHRFDAMERLAAAGIPTGVWINPVLPFLTDSRENFRALLRRAKDAGAGYAITHYGMTLREGNREYFYQALDRRFPGLKARYAHAYGLAYVLPCPNAEALHAFHTQTCQSLGLAHTFEAAATLLRKSAGYEQSTLF